MSFWRRYRTVWITLATVVAVAVTASLGRWQLSRAAQKEALQAAIDARAAMPALDSAALRSGLAAAGELLHRRVQLSGRWLDRYTVFLDNRQMQSRQGFFVITPLAIEGSQDVVLVQRGWVPRDFQDRTRLPAVSTPGGLVTVQGRWAGSPARLLDLGAAQTSNGFERIRQNVDTSAFAQETGLRLLPGSVLQMDDAGGSVMTDGLVREWPRVASGTEKHYGYAFQWFGLCALLMILYVWFQIVRRIRLS